MCSRHTTCIGSLRYHCARNTEAGRAVITVFYFTLWVRPAEGQEFAGDDPVEVSVLYTLETNARETKGYESYNSELIMLQKQDMAVQREVKRPKTTSKLKLGQSTKYMYGTQTL